MRALRFPNSPNPQRESVHNLTAFARCTRAWVYLRVSGAVRGKRRKNLIPGGRGAALPTRQRCDVANVRAVCLSARLEAVSSSTVAAICRQAVPRLVD